MDTQIPSMKGFGDSYFHVWHSNLGWQLEELSLEGFQEGHEDAYDVARQSAFIDSYHILLAELGDPPI